MLDVRLFSFIERWGLFSSVPFDIRPSIFRCSSLLFQLLKRFMNMSIQALPRNFQGLLACMFHFVSSLKRETAEPEKTLLLNFI